MSDVQNIGRWLAKELAAGQREVKSLLTPQLGTSSIEAGQVQEYDAEGTLVSITGEQFDGTHGSVTVAGPVPPEPITPTVTVAPSQIEVRWNGKFVDDALSPMDFSHVSVHASRDEFFEPDSTTQMATITGESGDSATVMLEPGDWAVLLVAVSKAGKWSDPSETVPVAVPDADVSGLQDVMLELDGKLETAAADLVLHEGRLVDAESDLTNAFGQLGTVDTRVAAAKAAAMAAARSYLNPGTTTEGMVTVAGVSPAVADSPTAMGGKALRKTGTGNGWWADRNGKQAFDPTALYRMTLRVRVVTPATNGTKAVYMGVQGYAADGTTLVNASGSNSTAAQHYLVSGNFPAAEAASGAWVDYVAYFQGNAAGSMTGAGTFADPKKLHNAVRWVEPLMILDYANGDGVWEVSHFALDIITPEIVTAQTTATNALTMAGTKGKAYRSTSPASGQGTAAGDLWRQVDANNVVIAEWQWDGSEWKQQTLSGSQVSNMDIGYLTAGAATMSQALIDKLVAGTAAFQQVDVKNLFVSTGVMSQAVIDNLWAKVVKAYKISADMLEANLILATDIIAGNSAAGHARMTPAGFKVFGPGVDGGAPTEVASMGTGDGKDVIGIVGPEGQVMAGFNAEGKVTGQDFEVAKDIKIDGDSLLEMLNARPRGLKAWQQFPRGGDSQWPTLTAAGEVGLFEIGWDTSGDTPARMYEVNVPSILIDSTTSNASTIGLRMRYTDDQSAPTVSSPLLTYDYGYASGNGFRSAGFSGVLIGSPNGPYIRVLISLYSTGPCKLNGNSLMEVVVNDLGLYIPPGGSITTGGASKPAPAVPVVTKTVTYNHTSVKSFLGNNQHYNYNTAKGYQGLQPYTSNGILKSLWTFPLLTGLLTGATVNKIEAYFYFEHWNNGSGGTARIVLHGNSGQPATYSDLGPAQPFVSSNWPRGAGRWVTIPSAYYAGFANGTYKGFGLLGDGTLTTYGIASAAKIRVTYTK